MCIPLLNILQKDRTHAHAQKDKNRTGEDEREVKILFAPMLSFVCVNTSE